MKYQVNGLRARQEFLPNRNANTFAGVALEGKRLVIGTDTGSQRILNLYEQRGALLEYVQGISVADRLTGEMNAVAVSNDGTLVACGDSYNDLPSGAVFLYNLAVGDTQYDVPVNYTLTLAATLTLTPAVADAYFGAACCINAAKDRLYIGAPGVANDRGSVFVFDKVGATWTQGQEIPGPTSQKGFGTAVSASADGSILAVGAAWAEYYWGRAYLYVKDGNGIYQLRDTLVPGDEGGQFGQGIAITPDGKLLFVGVPTYSLMQSRQGMISVFSYADGVWTKGMNTMRQAGWGWENLGLNLAISGSGQQLVTGLAASAITYDVYRYRLKGTVVNENGQPGGMKINAFNTTTGEFVNNTWSDTDLGGAFEMATISQDLHCLICHDEDDEGLLFNAIAMDQVTPL